LLHGGILPYDNAMFFPLSDDDRALVKPTYVTWSVLAVNVLMFLYQFNNPEFTYGYAAVPAEITRGVDIVRPVEMPVGGDQTVLIPHFRGPRPIYFTLITSMFLHGGFAHIAGNMLFLWIFGDNVEHRFGHVRFLLFYLVSGIVGSIAQIAIDPSSIIPTLGASGAISGVLGAYIVLFPHNRVNAIFFFQVVTVPAYLVIGMWAFTQFFSGWGSIAQTSQTGGVAYAAHIGGFVAGVAIALLSRVHLGEEPDTVLKRVYQRDPRDRMYW
jgi:membrane associated rhomboid family serine protease